MIMTLIWTASLALAGQPAVARVGPSAAMLAQAQDRCMTTFAVRLSRTTATDEAIFAKADAGCTSLKQQLGAAIAREYSADQAAALTATLDAQAKPNFLALVQRIRTDRRDRAGN